MTTRTLAEQADEYTADAAAPGSVAETAIRRAYMAGALAAATSKLTREQLMAELVQYGRSVGTAAERARA